MHENPVKDYAFPFVIWSLLLEMDVKKEKYIRFSLWNKKDENIRINYINAL